jgi:hypothetical protein
MRKGIRYGAVGAAAAAVPALVGLLAHEASATDVNHEIRVVSGLAGSVNSVSDRSDSPCPPAGYNYHAPCGESPLDLTNYPSTGLGTFFSAQQYLNPGAALRGRVQKYGITSICLGVKVDIWDDSVSPSRLLGSTYYVHISKDQYAFNHPVYDYDFGIPGGNGQWTVHQLGWVHGDDGGTYGTNPDDPNGPDAPPNGCAWYGPDGHLHQGGWWNPGFGGRNDDICAAYDDCSINPTNDTTNKWLHRYVWTTVQQPPTATPAPPPGGGGGSVIRNGGAGCTGYMGKC